MNTIRINVNDVAEIAALSIRRAYVFMGLGVNASRDERLKDFHLSGLMRLEVVPSEATDEQLNKYKDAFRTWIIGNGLREITEGFEHYLADIYRILILATDRRANALLTNKRSIENYMNKGVSGRFNELSERYGIEQQKWVDLHALTKARNCLTHRRGIIEPRDCNGERKLSLRWRCLDIHIETGTEKIDITSAPLEPIAVEKGGVISASFSQRCREYNEGTILRINPEDLREICFASQLAVSDINKSFVGALANLGANIID